MLKHQPSIGEVGRILGKFPKLEQQAFSKISGEHAGGIKLLQPAEHRDDFVLFNVQGRFKTLEKLIHPLAEKAVSVQCVDQRFRDQKVTLGQAREVQLPAKLIGEVVRLFRLSKSKSSSLGAGPGPGSAVYPSQLASTGRSSGIARSIPDQSLPWIVVRFGRRREVGLKVLSRSVTLEIVDRTVEIAVEAAIQVATEIAIGRAVEITFRASVVEIAVRFAAAVVSLARTDCCPGPPGFPAAFQARKAAASGWLAEAGGSW